MSNSFANAFTNLSEDFFARYEFYFFGFNLIDATLDLNIPGFVDLHLCGVMLSRSRSTNSSFISIGSISARSMISIV